MQMQNANANATCNKFQWSYALDFPICTDSAQAAGRNERYALANIMKRSSYGAAVENYFPADYEACDSDWVRVFAKYIWFCVFLSIFCIGWVATDGATKKPN